MREMVVIKKEWDNANIQMLVTDSELSITIQLDEFVKALAFESSGIATVVTKQGLLTILKTACNKVVAGMKDETRKIMT